MRSFITIMFVALTVIGQPARAQKIETQKPDRNRIVRVQTALNHLTVIEVGEPVTTVAAGSSLFKIEWRENKVFIQPTEPSVATNLFIWTKSGRLNYELEPAGAIEKMDFAIDHPPLELASVRTPAVTPGSQSTAGWAPTAVLLGSRSVRVEDWKPPKKRVQVILGDVFQRDDRFFIRYVVRNQSRYWYAPGTPRVFVLNAPRSVRSLKGLANSQLSAAHVARLKPRDQTPVEVVEGAIRSQHLDPGQETVGVVAVKLPTKTSAATVLRLLFPEDGNGPISATLVL